MSEVIHQSPANALATYEEAAAAQLARRAEHDAKTRLINDLRAAELLGRPTPDLAALAAQVAALEEEIASADGPLESLRLLSVCESLDRKLAYERKMADDVERAERLHREAIAKVDAAAAALAAAQAASRHTGTSLEAIRAAHSMAVLGRERFEQANSSDLLAASARFGYELPQPEPRPEFKDFVRA